jgi:hypothetical protein
VQQEAVSRAGLVKQAAGDDLAAARRITNINFTAYGATTSGVVRPVVQGVSISVTVSGTDGFYMSLVLKTNASGSVSFSIPPAAPPVKDTITLMVVLTGVKARWVYPWPVGSPGLPAAGASSRVRRP